MKHPGHALDFRGLRRPVSVLFRTGEDFARQARPAHPLVHSNVKCVDGLAADTAADIQISGFSPTVHAFGIIVSFVLFFLLIPLPSTPELACI